MPTKRHLTEAEKAEIDQEKKRTKAEITKTKQIKNTKLV